MQPTYRQLRQVINYTLKIPAKKIKKHTSLCNELNITGWELDLLANHVEIVFKINVNDKEWHSNKTINDMVRSICDRIHNNNYP